MLSKDEIKGIYSSMSTSYSTGGALDSVFGESTYIKALGTFSANEEQAYAASEVFMSNAIAELVEFIEKIVGPPSITCVGKTPSYVWVNAYAVVIVCNLYSCSFKVGCYVVTFDEELFDKVRTKTAELAEKFEIPDDRSVHALLDCGPHMGIEPIEDVNKPLERENYTTDQLRDYDMIVREIVKEEPRARLVIIDGPTGTGKSFYVRGMVHEATQAQFLVLSSSLIEKLEGPTLLSVLFSHIGGKQIVSVGETPRPKRRLVLIIEDGDFTLIPRMGDNMAALSTLLQVSDGFIGKGLNLRVIVLTNAKTDEMDSALKRPGRLLCHVTIGELSPDHASRVLKRLSGVERPFDKRQSLASVYEMAHKIRSM